MSGMDMHKPVLVQVSSDGLEYPLPGKGESVRGWVHAQSAWRWAEAGPQTRREVWLSFRLGLG